MGIVRFFLEAVSTLGFEQTASLLFLGKKGLIHRFDTHGINTTALKQFFETGDYEALLMMFQGFEAVEYGRLPWHMMNRRQKIGIMMFLSSGFEEGDITWGNTVAKLISDGIHDEDRDVRLWAVRALLSALSSGEISPTKVLSMVKDVPSDITPYLYAMGLLPHMIPSAVDNIVPFVVYGMISGVKLDIMPIWDLLNDRQKEDVLKYVAMAVDARQVRFHDGILGMVKIAMEDDNREVKLWALKLLASGVFHGDVSRDAVASFIDMYYQGDDTDVQIWLANIVFHAIRYGTLQLRDIADILLYWIKTGSTELFEKVIDIVNRIITSGKLSEEFIPVIEAIKDQASSYEGEYWKSVEEVAQDILKSLGKR